MKFSIIAAALAAISASTIAAPVNFVHVPEGHPRWLPPPPHPHPPHPSHPHDRPYVHPPLRPAHDAITPARHPLETWDIPPNASFKEKHERAAQGHREAYDVNGRAKKYARRAAEQYTRRAGKHTGKVDPEIAAHWNGVADKHLKAQLAAMVSDHTHTETASGTGQPWETHRLVDDAQQAWNSRQAAVATIRAAELAFRLSHAISRPTLDPIVPTSQSRGVQSA